MVISYKLVISLQVLPSRNEAKGDDEWAYFPKQKADLDTTFFFPFPKCQVGHHFSLASHLATDRLILACANRSPDLQPALTSNLLLSSSENCNVFTVAR